MPSPSTTPLPLPLIFIASIIYLYVFRVAKLTQFYATENGMYVQYKMHVENQCDEYFSPQKPQPLFQERVKNKQEQQQQSPDIPQIQGRQI